MVDVIIAVLPISADTVKIINCIQVLHQGDDLLIGVEISRISLLDAFHMVVQNL